MKHELIQNSRSITVNSGKIKDIARNIEQLNIRGSVAIHQELHLQKISIHGYSSFYSNVVAQFLKTSGTCKLKDNCQINEINNTGNLLIRDGQITTLNSSGKITIEQSLQAGEINANGIVNASKIQAQHFHLTMSGESIIDELFADSLFVKKDKLSFSIFYKRLKCKHIKGKKLNISFTIAECIDGDEVIIGDKCIIQTLYYTDSYTISPNAKVQHIIRREKE
ncbi:hypothetical protein [Solibacillus sp. CAU 1738]|uniref:hypothetical protein n=1 Tax=Solibacillus sp. CAU 1738 TaxID=3140363 RepID=UPI0032603014